MQTIKIEQTGSQCIVSWRHFSNIVYIRIFFLTVLTVISLYLLYNAFNAQLNQATILCALVVWVYWLYEIRDVSNLLFGNTRLILDENGFHSVQISPPFKRERRLAFTDIRQFETLYQGWYASLYVTRANGKKIYFTASRKTPQTELDNLRDRLNAFLSTQKPPC